MPTPYYGSPSEFYWGVTGERPFDPEGLAPLQRNSETGVHRSSNRKFVYPDRTIRIIDENGRPKNIKLKRGYIRSLNYGSVGAQDAVCAFQFNPQTLTQVLQQNTNMLDILHMDPAQYAQPIPANQNFTFELLFDRSAEVNAAPRNRNSRDNKWDSDPTRNGVLHDIYQLYSATGAGISRVQRAYIKQVLDDQIKGEINALGVSEENPLDGKGGIPLTTADAAASAFIDEKNSFIDANVGNSGFLIPIPVRAVFSEYYMVEGLVSNIQVQFVKFDANMIPMMANVVITMEAKYVGFAKARTFLTRALEDRQNASLISGTTTGSGGLYDLVKDMTTIKAAYTANVSGSDKEALATSTTTFTLIGGPSSSNTSKLSYLRIYPSLPKLTALAEKWKANPSSYSMKFSRMPGVPTAVYRLAPSFALADGNAGAVNALRALSSGSADALTLSYALQKVISLINRDYSDSLDTFTLWSTAPSNPVVNSNLRSLQGLIFPRCQVVREEKFDPVRFYSYESFNNHRDNVSLWTDETEYLSTQPRPDRESGTPGGDDRSWAKITFPSGGSGVVLAPGSEAKQYATNFSLWDWLIVYGINITLSSTDDSIVGTAVGYKWISRGTAASEEETNTRVDLSVRFPPSSSTVGTPGLGRPAEPTGSPNDKRKVPNITSRWPASVL